MPRASLTIQNISDKIYTIRGVKVMLDRDLAVLYKVTTGNLNLAVKRNKSRFPKDFMFQLSKAEFKNWTLQFAISNSDKKGLRRPPYAFTEQGVAMLSSVLKSKIAVQVNIKIMRAFIEMRHAMASQPQYELLKERIKRIESDLLIENKLMSGKLTQLSQKVHEISELFDRFQDSHIVIQRPNNGEYLG